MSGGLDPTPRLTPARIAFQVVGFGISIALFVWVVRSAMSEENAESLERLRHAPLLPVLALLGATFASVTFNGLIFWATVRPIRKLDALGVVSTNAIATFLSILPFKINFISRVMIHRKRDGMRFVDIGAWLISVMILGLSVFTCLGVITFWRRELDPIWWAATAASIVIVCLSAVVLGRLSEKRPWLAKMSLGSWRIVRRPSAVLSSTLFRLIDITALGGRFLAAGAIIGYPITSSQAFTHGVSYFMVSVFSPAGVLGFREAASKQLGMSADGAEQFALIALLVTFAELLVAGAMALAGAIYLRVDRLLLPGRTKKPLTDGGASRDEPSDAA